VSEGRLFGGIQEFVSFDFYENVLKWAADHRVLNTDLDEYTWGNRMFQFRAGDLYGVISDIEHKFYASYAVKGECESSSSGLKVYKNA
jgi:hypothetical protein